MAGELVEHNLTLLTDGVETHVGAGRVFSFGPDHIHRLTGAGVLRRISRSYADELKPVD